MAPTLLLLSLADQTLDNTVGVMMLGMVGASLLFGITTVQAYWYYHTYPNDSLLHKFAVSILWVLDAFHLTLVIYAVYGYAITEFGNTVALYQISWSIKLQASVNILIILVVHSLYAMRVWLLGGYHRGFLKYVVASVVAAGFGVGVFLSYSTYTIITFSELEKISWVIDAALGTSTAIDFVIAAAMCYYLRKSQGTISSLNSRIATVMQYSLSSGLLTSACSLAAMFTYILLPNTLIFLAIEFLVTKLYVGSFIAMLNARERKTNITSYSDEYSSQPSWRRHKATSSFWSPRPFSLALPADGQEPQPPPPIATKNYLVGQAF